ncbi:MAG TPA: hypothetical protein VLP43_04280 [Solirubrobacteraceae bacterium]|nr:hypothetical protein [Solirubrobacteraceae bacterium]
MPSPLINRTISGASRRVPGLRRLPVFQLLALAEVLLLAQRHVVRLTPSERRRVLELVRTGRGRRRNLTPLEHAELADLVEKAAPREFLAAAVHRVSPVPFPRPIIDFLVKPRSAGRPPRRA